MRAPFPVVVAAATGTTARSMPTGVSSVRAPGTAPALGRLVALEVLAQRELSCIPRMRLADAPERDDLLAILVAWDLAL